MSNDGYGTSTEEMARAGTHVLTVNDNVQGELSALRGKLVPLAGLWQGDAALQFARLMERWDSNAKVLSQALTDIGQAIGGTATTYDAEEFNQQQAFTNISAALG